MYARTLSGGIAQTLDIFPNEVYADVINGSKYLEYYLHFG